MFAKSKPPDSPNKKFFQKFLKKNFLDTPLTLNKERSKNFY